MGSRLTSLQLLEAAGMTARKEASAPFARDNPFAIRNNPFPTRASAALLTPIGAIPMTSTTNSTLHDGGALRGAIVLALISLVGFGALYSVVGAGIGGVLFPAQAGGSVIERDGKVVGSALLAQPFTDARYFQPRPSAAKYDPMSAAGSNQSRTNPDMRKRIDDAVAEIAKRDGVAVDQVPADLVTQSGGGLDPDISPQGAQIQVARVATARGLAPDVVAKLVADNTTPKQFGLLGEARVNVLQLNLALDAAR